MPKKLLCVLSAVMLVSASLFSCSETSEPSSLLREHELDALISRAENSEPPMPSAGESQESVRLSFELGDGERGVTAVADAEIVLPQTALSVYGVRRRSFTQETVDMLRRELLGDAKLYDGGALEVPTRDDLALRIDMLERELDECTDSARREYLTEELAECRVAYESAPSTVTVTPYPSDGKLASPSARLASGELSEYYRWSASMNPDGEVLYAVTDGSDGYYSVLYVQNCSSYGSKLVYRKNRVSWESHEGVLSTETSF